MTVSAKTCAYLAAGEEIVQLARTSRIKVSSQKTDMMLADLKDDSSTTSRFTRTVADDDVLRTFFMLSSSTQQSLNEKFPAMQSYPIVFDPGYDIFKRLKEVYTKEEEAVKKKKDTILDEIKEINQSTFYSMVQTIFKDQAVIRKRASRAPEFKKAIDLALERNKDEASSLVSGFMNKFMTMVSDFQLYNKVVEFLGLTTEAQANATALASLIKLPDERMKLFASLNALARTDTVKIETESLCLDCYFKYKDDPYSSTMSNVRDFELPSSCPRCKDLGVFHKIQIHFPRGLHRLILPETNWIQEAIVGFKLTDVTNVERVFIHKKIQFLPPTGGPGSSVESDISLITSDGRLIVIEVTSQSDLANLMKEFNKKTRNLEQANIPFSSLGYVTASTSSEQFLPLSDGRDRLFFIRHIARISDFVSDELVNPQ